MSQKGRSSLNEYLKGEGDFSGASEGDLLHEIKPKKNRHQFLEKHCKASRLGLAFQRGVQSIKNQTLAPEIEGNQMRNC